MLLDTSQVMLLGPVVAGQMFFPSSNQQHQSTAEINWKTVLEINSKTFYLLLSLLTRTIF